MVVEKHGFIKIQRKSYIARFLRIYIINSPNIFGKRGSNYGFGNIFIILQKYCHLTAHEKEKEANMRQKQKERDAMPQPKTDLAYLRSEKAKAEQKQRA